MIEILPDDQDRAASEAALDAELQRIDQSNEQGGGQANGEAAPGGIDAEQSLEGLLMLVPIGFNAAGYSNAAAVWSDSARKTLAQAAIPVFRKYPWGQKIIAFLESGSGVEEMALAFTAYQLGMGTMQAMARDKAAAAEKKRAEAAKDVSPEPTKTPAPAHENG